MTFDHSISSSFSNFFLSLTALNNPYRPILVGLKTAKGTALFVATLSIILIFFSQDLLNENYKNLKYPLARLKFFWNTKSSVRCLKNLEDP